jgi:hypothetical protein
MTKFSDQLFDDLIQEHGPQLAATRVPTAPKRRGARSMLAGAGAAVAAVGITVGVLAAGGGTPAYAVTNNADGTVTLSAYTQSGVTGANAQLQKLGDRVALVQVRSDCRSITSLPKVSNDGYVPFQMSVTVPGGQSFVFNLQGVKQLTINARDVPKGDVILVPVQPSKNGMLVYGQVVGKTAQALTVKTGVLTKAPAPSCVSVPKYTGGSSAQG